MLALSPDQSGPDRNWSVRPLRNGRNLCNLYGATVRAQRDHMMALLRRGKPHRWFQFCELSCGTRRSWAASPYPWAGSHVGSASEGRRSDQVPTIKVEVIRAPLERIVRWAAASTFWSSRAQFAKWCMLRAPSGVSDFERLQAAQNQALKMFMRHGFQPARINTSDSKIISCSRVSAKEAESFEKWPEATDSPSNLQYLPRAP
jgi:hypothetical protein